jgi:pentapeptide MXKDX repeat protein
MPGDKMPGDKSSGYYRTVRRTDENRPRIYSRANGGDDDACDDGQHPGQNGGQNGEHETDGHDGDAMPGDEMPGDGMPGDKMPGDDMPGDGMPGDDMPGDGMPGDKMPGDKSSGYYRTVRRTDENRPPFQRWAKNDGENHGHNNRHTMSRLVLNAARLTFIHRRFAPEWLYLRARFSPLQEREWKQWWAVTETDRLRLRVEIDALCADLYGLEPDDFDWIVRDDPSDPKGFWRVDKQLPFEERLTGLAARAFRALKEGKWFAETVGDLSNDAFFDVLGIPELTDPNAAKAKGLDGPLILKRAGCHAWHPERFTETDPRHGWTWDDCQNDAVALLGSEEKVRRYVAGEANSKKEKKSNKDDKFWNETDGR